MSPQATTESPHNLTNQVYPGYRRRRSKRACDKCSSSRTRCNGELPCSRCKEYGHVCAFSREIKKRGRRPNQFSDDGPAIGIARKSQDPQEPEQRTEPTNSSSREQNSPDGLFQRLFPEQVEPDPTVTVNRLGNICTSLGSIAGGFQGEPNCALNIAELISSTPSQLEQTDMSNENGRSLENMSTDRDSFSGEVLPKTGPELPCPRTPMSTGEHTSACRYPFLAPVLQYIDSIISASVACELLEVYLIDPGGSLFHAASPYVLTRIFRKQSMTSLANPRRTTPALLATILWCVAHTADLIILQIPGSRARIVNELYNVVMSLTAQRDPDRWRRVHGGLRTDTDLSDTNMAPPLAVSTTATNEPVGTPDDILSFILLSIVVSGSDFKSDSQKWFSKATRLAFSMGLNREDEICPMAGQNCPNPLCACKNEQRQPTLANFEYREECRRIFWLLYCLDRHLALSFNTTLFIPDSYCEVYTPLPEFIWENLQSFPLHELHNRTMGPPTRATGTSFFEYFLPLMALLGDILEFHRRREHPRLGRFDDTYHVLAIRQLLLDYESSLNSLSEKSAGDHRSLRSLHDQSAEGWDQNTQRPHSSAPLQIEDKLKFQLVQVYGMHILHILYILLYGKWDAICMMDDADGWILSNDFNECATHAISASQIIPSILAIDPELTFMSYLFGIYLLHGSFIILLFADRMPQLGTNKSVEEACENIIRAHEVAVVTLNTEFQKSFRKVLRSTLYSVQDPGTIDADAHTARRRILSLYRWTKGARGLNL